jgi:hypothetical protein
VSKSPQDETEVKFAQTASVNASSKVYGYRGAGRGFTGFTGRRSIRTGACYYCKGEGHFMAKCPHRKPGVYPNKLSPHQQQAGKQVNALESVLSTDNAVISVDERVQGNACSVRY